MSHVAHRIRTINHRHEPDSWRMDSLAPSRRLAPFLRRATAYTVQGNGLSRQRELPNGSAVLVFNLGSIAGRGRLGNFTAFRNRLCSIPDRASATSSPGRYAEASSSIDLPGAAVLGRPLDGCATA